MGLKTKKIIFSQHWPPMSPPVHASVKRLELDRRWTGFGPASLWRWRLSTCVMMRRRLFIKRARICRFASIYFGGTRRGDQRRLARTRFSRSWAACAEFCISLFGNLFYYLYFGKLTLWSSAFLTAHAKEIATWRDRSWGSPVNIIGTAFQTCATARSFDLRFFEFTLYFVWEVRKYCPWYLTQLVKDTLKMFNSSFSMHFASHFVWGPKLHRRELCQEEHQESRRLPSFIWHRRWRRNISVYEAHQRYTPFREGRFSVFLDPGSDYMHRASESLLRSCFCVHACIDDVNNRCITWLCVSFILGERASNRFYL